MIAQRNPYIIPSYEPAKYVIWGLGNTLKQNSPGAEAEFPRQCVRTAFKLAGQACDETGERFSELVAAAAGKYRSERRMTQFIAAQLGLREEVLFQQYYADLTTSEAMNKDHHEKEVVDQGILNAFYKTAEGTDDLPRIEHRLLTNASTYNAIFWLSRMGIKPFFSEIIGLDAVTCGQDAKRLNLANKAENEDAIHRVMRGIPAERHKDVIVIDNDEKFLDLFKDTYPKVKTCHCKQFEERARQQFSMRYIPGHKVADKVATFMNIMLKIQADVETGPYNVAESRKRVIS